MYHQVTLTARISLSVSLCLSLSLSLASLPNFILCPQGADGEKKGLAGQPTLGCPRVGIYRRTSLRRSSLLLQQCPACSVRLTLDLYIMHE